jgi:hypothetical protein
MSLFPPNERISPNLVSGAFVLPHSLVSLVQGNPNLSHPIWNVGHRFSRTPRHGPNPCASAISRREFPRKICLPRIAIMGHDSSQL